MKGKPKLPSKLELAILLAPTVAVCIGLVLWLTM